MRLRWAITLLSLVASSQLPGFTQEKSAEKPASPQEYSKEAYVIEQSTMRVAAEADGTGSRELTVVVKMLAEAGVKTFAVLNFTYTSANEVVDIDYVRVRKPDGTVVKTPDYNIQDMPAEVTRTAPLYSDIHEKHVAVKGLGVGDTLEYLVRFRVVKAEVPGHFWFEHYFQKTAIIKSEELEVSVPANKYVKVVSPDYKAEIKNEGGRRIYDWKYSNLQVAERDPSEIPRRNPPNPSVQVTSFATWEEIGRWYEGLQKDSVRVTPEIQAKAAELTKGLKTDEEKVHALYNFVSLRFHYIGLDFGIGRYQPHAAEDVLENGYGDCKDKHTLLASLLKAGGYDAWPVLIHGSRKLDPEVPSPAQFNHVITVVQLGPQRIWLDTTPEVAPYGLLLLVLRNKQALLIPANDAPLLVTTPANPPFPQEQNFSMQGELSGDGTFTGHAEQFYRGDEEVALRMAFRQIPQSQWKEAVQRFSYGMNFGGEVSNVNVSSPEELETPFRLSYDYKRKDYADWQNHQIVLPLPPMGLEVTKDSKETKPKEPVLLGALGNVNYRARVDLPSGFSMTAPQAVNLIEPYVEYHTTNAVEKGVLTTTRKLTVKKNEVPLEDWQELRKFGRALADDEFNFIKLNGPDAAGKSTGDDADATFKEGSEALRRREFVPAQESFEKVIAKQPKRPQAHYSLGLALASQNKLDDALAEFHKEEDISPDYTYAYLMASSIDTSRGRIDDAIAEFRKLLKADPENQDGAANLGMLLEQEGKYPEAAQVLEAAVKNAPENATLQYQLGSAYLKTAETQKAVEHLKAAAEAKGGNAMMLNNVAYELAENKTNLELAREYADKALRQLDERSAGDVDNMATATQYTVQLSMVWDTMGWIHFQSGEMNKAENFVRAAWLLRQDPVIGEHLGEVYEKEKKVTEAEKTYELAVAAVNLQPFGMPGGLSRNQKQADEISSRYQKLAGKKPSINESRCLPNGQWTKTIGEQLSQIRSVSFGKQPGLSGSAEFKIVFAPGKVESVVFLNGDESLKALSDKLRAAPYQVEFPVGSQAKLLRRAVASCHPLTGCMAVLIPAERSSVSPPPSSTSQQ